jgi:NAD(P)-dependent dehydrogenase (short-subunit alcohol dehydrogenase family)
VILEGKTVVVCGVGRGLGAEVVRLALRDGARVMMAARTQATLEALAAELDPSGQRLAFQRSDVTDVAQCEALAAAAQRRFDGIDALVHVAALDTLFGGLADTSAEDWRAAFEVNVLGTAQLVRAVASGMKANGGSVVLIGSQSSMLPAVPQIAYASSKGALRTAMYFMARELGRDRIRVNTVVPTWMWGPPVEAYVAAQAKQRGVPEAEIVADITSRMAIPEIPADEDVAEAVIFFCSDRSRTITGQTLLVNSGELMP